MKKKKKSIKKNKNKKEKKTKEEFNIFDDEIIDEEELSDVVIEEPEDDSEFVAKVQEFEKNHSNTKLINVYELIGKPKIIDVNKLNNKKLLKEFNKLVQLLDKNNIIVYFQNDYSIEEKYRFIIEEIFKQDIEHNNNHTRFIYEEFHPEYDNNDEIEEGV